MSSSMPSSYEPSGRFSASFFAYVLLAAGLSVGLGWVYQWLISIVPLIYVNLLFTAGFGVALWFVMSWAVQFGRCRNPMLAALIGLAVGLIGLAASHYFDYLAAYQTLLENKNLGAQTQAAIQEKFGFWDWISVKVEQGYQITRARSSSGGGLPLSGAFVYLVWGIEAVVIGGAGAASSLITATLPYCESCDEWSETDGVYSYPNPANPVLTHVANATSTESLVQPGVDFGNDNRRSLAYEVETCPSCDESNFLSVSLETITYDSDGEEQIDEDVLWANLEVKPQTIDSVSELQQRVVDRARASHDRNAEDEVEQTW